MKMAYAILVYNHSIHSVNKLKPVNIISGHLIDIGRILTNNNVNNHKKRSRIFHQKINWDVIEGLGGKIW